MNNRKFIKKILIFAVIVFLCLWFGTLIKNDILTIVYGKNFTQNYQEYVNFDSLDYLKVIKYNKDYAEVYYVTDNKSTAEIVSFKKINGKWIFNEWERTVWSRVGGSASEVIWPYWGHFVYGGF